MSAPTSATLTAFVRAAGSDLDDLGPPGIGRHYLVLEIPQGHNAMVQEALLTGRIQIHAAPCRIVPDETEVLAQLRVQLVQAIEAAAGDA